MISIMKYCLLLFIIIVSVGCNSKSDIEKEIERIPISVDVIRFDKAFGSATIADLPELKQQFPLFFPKQFADSIWQQRITDTLQKQLNTEVLNTFPNEIDLKTQLEYLFQHIKYYFPEFRTPLVYTTTSDVDYKNKVIATDNLLIIALDTYLGSNHLFYDGIQKYLAKNMKPSQLIVDVAAEYAGLYISKPLSRSFLSQMIYYGKELYLKNLWLPNTPDYEKIGYSEEELTWSNENEVEMWRYFVEKELLFSTDAKLTGRFIDPAPFSKFYLEIDNQSPGMIGRYLGWQIVKSYMKNNQMSIQQLLILDAEEIFTNSKYKPKK